MSDLFGRQYNEIGSVNSDFLIKTKGKVKIQWGNKFIDLIKDGKLNMASDFIYKVDSVDSIRNNSGIYVTKDGFVYLKLKGEPPLDLKGDIGTTYVSFMQLQETSPSHKYTALQNLGLVQPSIDSLNINSLQNGVVFIEDTQKIYFIKDGNFNEFKVDFPNPFKEQFVISKSDSSKGSLHIIGEGINNSIAFDSLYIYKENSKSLIESNIPLEIKIGENVATFDRSKIILNREVSTNAIQSVNASADKGFRLYIAENKSILEVDKIIVRDQTTGSILYPELWLQAANIINTIDKEENTYTVEFQYEHTYKVGDRLRFYVKEILEDFVECKPVDVEVLEVLDNAITFTYEEDLDDLQNTLIFSTNSGAIQIKNNNIDIIVNDKVHSRYGNIGKIIDNQEDAFGVYSENAAFKKAQYTEDYNLDLEDESTAFSSTEWVKKVLQNLLPKGCIIMFDGKSSIPTGWHICDGTEGTPNLIGKFVKADTKAGQTGGSNTQSFNIGVPEHTHTFSVASNSEGFVISKENSLHTGIVDWGGSRNYCLLNGYEKNNEFYDLQKTINGETEPYASGDSSITVDIQPEYYTLIYIMKIS